MTYIDASTLWKSLGKDAYTKVRAEAVGTLDGSTTTWALDQDSLVNSTFTLYTDGSSVSTGSYSINLDDGTVTGFAGTSGNALTADYDYSDIEDSYIQDLLTSTDDYIEEKTGRVYSLQTGNIEYLNVDPEEKTFFVQKYPVTALTTVEVNTSSSLTDTPSWSTSVSGIGNDYISNTDDLLIGRIRFIDNYPEKGNDRIKVTYNAGFATTPGRVKELAILVSTQQLMNSSIYKSIFKGKDNFTPVKLDAISKRIDDLINMLTKNQISLS